MNRPSSFAGTPVCAEVELGPPAPREPIHLDREAEDPRLVSIKTRENRTERRKAWARGRVEELAKVGLHGFVFKKDSPLHGCVPWMA
jgi:uncharacterized protein YbbK (DUF523 family)